jgi:DNA-binding LytR/AlgR family response regulator
VRSVGRIEQILVADILWIESAGNYVELHLAGRTRQSGKALNWFLDSLAEKANIDRLTQGL